MSDFALLDKVLHGSRHVLDRNIRIDAVLIEQINKFGLQPPQRRLGDLSDVLGLAVEAGVYVAGFEAELCCDRDLCAEGRRCFAQQLLVRERTISLGGSRRSRTILRPTTASICDCRLTAESMPGNSRNAAVD